MSVFDDIADQCESGEFSSINVASRVWSEAIIAAREELCVLRARIDKVLSDAGLLSSEQIVDILEGNDAI